MARLVSHNAGQFCIGKGVAEVVGEHHSAASPQISGRNTVMVKEQLDSSHTTPLLKLRNLSQNELGTAKEVAPAYTMGSNVIRQVGQSLGPELGGEDRNIDGEKMALHVVGRSRARRRPGAVKFRYVLSVLADHAAILRQNVLDLLSAHSRGECQ